MTDTTIAWLGAVGTVAQVVVAVVALYLAYRANRLNKDALFMERMVAELFEIVTLARRVKGLYARMFDPFEDVEEKVAARSAWLKAREEIDERLAEIQCMFSEVSVAAKAWEVLAGNEDTHIMSDALTIAKKDSVVEVTQRYAREHDVFVQEVGKLMRTLRR